MINIWDIACISYLKQILIQTSPSSSVEELYVASGYFIGQYRYGQVNAKEKPVKVLKQDYLSDRYYNESCNSSL